LNFFNYARESRFFVRGQNETTADGDCRYYLFCLHYSRAIKVARDPDQPFQCFAIISGITKYKFFREFPSVLSKFTAFPVSVSRIKGEYRSREPKVLGHGANTSAVVLVEQATY
jgi:hypothetical protein